MGLVLPTVCAICQQKFTTPAVADLVSTDSGKERLGTILEALVTHVRTEHKQAYQVAALQASQLLRLIVLMQFTTEDQGAVQMRDFMRYSIWSQLAKNRPATNDELKEIVKKLTLARNEGPRVLDVLTQCRDIWCEMGKYQPQPIIPATNAEAASQLVKA